MLADLPEVVHGFFTRQGGASAGAYHSLNVSLVVGDRREAVAENLGRMRQALGLVRLAGAAQVHGGRAAVITSPDQARLADIPEVDILVTTVPGLGLLIKQADCQAVMFYDPVNRVVANVHAGWRGQGLNILGETVQLLQSRFGDAADRPLCRVGPSLGAPAAPSSETFARNFPRPCGPTRYDLPTLISGGSAGTNWTAANFCRRASTWPASAPAAAPTIFTPIAGIRLPAARGPLSCLRPEPGVRRHGSRQF